MPRYPVIISILLLFQGIIGCEGDPGTGPVAVKWDRYTCERCRMVLSDPKHAAQIRLQTSDGRSRVLFFDDIGCAVIWLEEQPARDDPATEIWVSDWQTGKWISALEARYIPGQVTPMEYGLGAQMGPAGAGLSYPQAKAHIFEVERRFNVHGAQLQQQATSRRQ